MTNFCGWNIIVEEKYLIFCPTLFVTVGECESVCEIESDKKEKFIVFTEVLLRSQVFSDTMTWVWVCGY
jgi:hypothetical protein